MILAWVVDGGGRPRRSSLSFALRCTCVSEPSYYIQTMHFWGGHTYSTSFTFALKIFSIDTWIPRECIIRQRSLLFSSRHLVAWSGGATLCCMGKRWKEEMMKPRCNRGCFLCVPFKAKHSAPINSDQTSIAMEMKVPM